MIEDIDVYYNIPVYKQQFFSIKARILLPYPLTPSPTFKINYTIDKFVGEGELIERGLRPLSLRTPAWRKGGDRKYSSYARSLIGMLALPCVRIFDPF
jgi:hypothetical protein